MSICFLPWVGPQVSKHVCILLTISGIFCIYRMNVYLYYVEYIHVWHALQCLSITRNYKKIAFFLLFLCSTNAMHVPNCFIVVLLHVFNSMCSFLDVASCSSVTLGNNLLNMCTSIILPLLPVSILYGTIILFWSADVFNIAGNTDQFLLN